MIITKRYKTISYNDIPLSLDEIYEAMGGAGEPNPDLDREVETLIGELRAFLAPQFAFYISDSSNIDTESNRLTIERETFSVGRIISRQLRKSSRLVVFVATAGREFEQWQHKLQAEGDMLRIFIADCIGSVIAEKAADAMEAELQAEADKEGWLHTNRYSPGYCGWHVSEQQKLFSIMPDTEPCGITLTESSLMMPIKSVSGVIGIGADVKKMDYTCGLCSYADCFRRKKRG